MGLFLLIVLFYIASGEEPTRRLDGVMVTNADISDFASELITLSSNMRPYSGTGYCFMLIAAMLDIAPFDGTPFDKAVSNPISFRSLIRRL